MYSSSERNKDTRWIQVATSEACGSIRGKQLGHKEQKLGGSGLGKSIFKYQKKVFFVVVVAVLFIYFLNGTQWVSLV